MRVNGGASPSQHQTLSQVHMDRISSTAPQVLQKPPHPRLLQVRLDCRMAPWPAFHLLLVRRPGDAPLASASGAREPARHFGGSSSWAKMKSTRGSRHL